MNIFSIRVWGTDWEIWPSLGKHKKVNIYIFFSIFKNKSRFSKKKKHMKSVLSLKNVGRLPWFYLPKKIAIIKTFCACSSVFIALFVMSAIVHLCHQVRISPFFSLLYRIVSNSLQKIIFWKWGRGKKQRSWGVTGNVILTSEVNFRISKIFFSYRTRTLLGWSYFRFFFYI